MIKHFLVSCAQIPRNRLNLLKSLSDTWLQILHVPVEVKTLDILLEEIAFICIKENVKSPFFTQKN